MLHSRYLRDVKRRSDGLFVMNSCGQVSTKGKEVPSCTKGEGRHKEELRGGRSLRNECAGEQRGLVSIVTVTFNAFETLGKTIDSVVAQTYENIEYLVVDGGSTDGTVELLRRRTSEIDLWVSEPDGGISDAFNKGIRLTRGEFVALVNADDWLDPRHIELSVEGLQASGADFTFGDLMLHGKGGEPQFTLAGDPEYGRRIVHAMPEVNHPSIVCRRRVYDEHGLYDTGFRMAMDYEWLLRGYKKGVRGIYVPGVVSHMSAGGGSQRRGNEALNEVRNASIRHGYPRSMANLRFFGRIIKQNARVLVEHWISRGAASHIRAVINRRYRPVVRHR